MSQIWRWDVLFDRGVPALYFHFAQNPTSRERRCKIKLAWSRRFVNRKPVFSGRTCNLTGRWIRTQDSCRTAEVRFQIFHFPHVPRNKRTEIGTLSFHTPDSLRSDRGNQARRNNHPGGIRPDQLNEDDSRPVFKASDSDDATSLSSAHERGGRSIVQTSETGENNHRAIIPLKKKLQITFFHLHSGIFWSNLEQFQFEEKL